MILENKITVITPHDEENNLIDGEIISFGKTSNDNFHSILLYEYGIKTYGKDSIFSILKECYMPNVFAYFLTEYYDNIVFLNVIDRNKGRGALLYLPQNPSLKQKNSANKVIKELKGYKIELNTNLRYVDGFVESDKTKLKKDSTLEIFSEKKGLSL